MPVKPCSRILSIVSRRISSLSGPSSPFHPLPEGTGENCVTAGKPLGWGIWHTPSRPASKRTVKRQQVLRRIKTTCMFNS